MKIHYCVENEIEVRDNLTDEEINEMLDRLTNNTCVSWWHTNENTICDDEVFLFLDDLNNGRK